MTASEPADPLTLGHAFFDRAREKLDMTVPAALTDPSQPATRGDIDLDPELWAKADAIPARPAAVLIGVVDRPEPGVILTQRTTSLPNHAGQIAFPGGKIDPEDETPLAAALREAEEEIGLDRALVDPIGYLDLYCTFSGFRILPVVSRVRPGYALTLNQGEVEDAFEVPLAFLMDKQNHALHSREWKGLRRRFYVMPWRERYIWGVTAGILRNLYERVYGR
jgi:8-oxo-dGTP pyrophosphatase MutT (NUDIX family)